MWRTHSCVPRSHSPETRFPNVESLSGMENGNECETVLSSFPLKMAELLLAVLGCIVSSTLVDIFLSVLEHAVHQSRQFSPHGGNRFGGSQSGAQAAELFP